jgi:hypothetical protein
MIKLLSSIFFLTTIAVAQHANASQAILNKDGDTGLAAFTDAVQVNMDPSVFGQAMTDELTLVVAAIRYSENGGPGREYGILHPKCPNTYRGQAGWCCATVYKNFGRYLETEPAHPIWMGDFIKFLGDRYAPIDAENDPNGLNANWVPNVTSFYLNFNAGIF